LKEEENAEIELVFKDDDLSWLGVNIATSKASPNIL